MNSFFAKILREFERYKIDTFKSLLCTEIDSQIKGKITAEQVERLKLEAEKDLIEKFNKQMTVFEFEDASKQGKGKGKSKPEVKISWDWSEGKKIEDSEKHLKELQKMQKIQKILSLGNDAVPIKMLVSDESIVELTYPKWFILGRGHDVYNLFDISFGNFRNILVKKLFVRSVSKEFVAIPIDLIETFVEINNAIHKQVRDVIKVGKKKEAWLEKMKKFGKQGALSADEAVVVPAELPAASSISAGTITKHEEAEESSMVTDNIEALGGGSSISSSNVDSESEDRGAVRNGFEALYESDDEDETESGGVTSSAAKAVSVATTQEPAKSSSEDSHSTTIVGYCNSIEYDNLILNHPMGARLLSEVFKIGGSAGVSLLLDLGHDSSVVEQIFGCVQEQGANEVLNRLLGLEVVSEDHNIQQAVLSLDYYRPDNKAITLSSTQDTVESVTDRTSIFGHKFYNTLVWHLKHIVYREEISQFKEILQRNGIDSSVDVLSESLNFKKSVLLKLHPDKGGSKEDFIAAQNLQKKFRDSLDVKGLIDDKIKAIQPIIHKATIEFKFLDSVVDSARLYYEPTTNNAKKVLLDSTYLYSIYQGVNGYSSVISALDISYQFYQGEYASAVTQGTTTISYMVAPYAISYIGIPYLGFAYGTAMAIYTGYGAVSNLYSFYQEYGSIEVSLRSATAYKDLTQMLSYSSLQYVYDFASATKEYEVQINNIKLVLEKAAIKTQLEAQGEFGKKLYDYIYGPLLEEKYALLNQALQGIITEDEIETLKAKHITITSDEQIYEHCMEIRNIEANINSSSQSNRDNGESSNADVEHYYCYNDKHKMLGHVLIGDNHFEVIESL